MVRLASQGSRVPQIARALNADERTVRTWLKRFGEQSVVGLEDRPRSGAPVTYTPEIVGEIVATSLTDPKALELPFGCWTVRRLAAYLNEERQIPIGRSRLDDLLLAEGLRWRSQEGWFGERATWEGAAGAIAGGSGRPVDPEFAEKRGSSTGFTPPRPPAA
jgi:transposase